MSLTLHSTHRLRPTLLPLPLSLLQATCCQRGVMGFWKFSTFLPLSILVLYQAGILQAASLGDMLESLPDPTILAEEETQLLLAALVKEYMRLKALQQETESYSLTEEKSNFVPTNVAPKSSGRRRRDLQA
ncbi:calcitonin gene-related peptide 1-like [Equus asinus]|uniref:calcitonin gene-related peptide 1-like n=1 Tax=Equus asinus TaxID=9793 RepID=UPI00071A1193|nr:calcitonin gene-related peptide 1-like [Equus asinus]